MYKRNAILYRDITLDIKDYLENNGADTINNFFKEYGFKQRIEYSKSSHGDIIHAEADEKRIWFKRENIAEPIPMEWESLGNRLMLTLLPSFFHCIKEGGLLLIDEFSSGFHNEQCSGFTVDLCFALHESAVQQYFKTGSNIFGGF